jgi:RHS repeat-associated protein
MVYDGDGKRRSYADSVILRNFLWDGENIARQTDVNGAPDRNYTLNPQLYGELISQDGPAFHHYDALGSTRNLTDGTQTVTDTRDYTAFGVINASSGTNLNRFWWLGKWGYYLQPDLGNVWVRARIVEPVDGRMKSRDPLGLHMNRYQYASASPVDLIDPSGFVNLVLTPPYTPGGSMVPSMGPHPDPPSGAFRVPDWCGIDQHPNYGQYNPTPLHWMPPQPAIGHCCKNQTWPNYINALRRKCADCEDRCYKHTNEGMFPIPISNPDVPIGFPSFPITTPMKPPPTGMPNPSEGLPGYPGGPGGRGQRPMVIPHLYRICLANCYTDQYPHGDPKHSSIDAAAEWQKAAKRCQRGG